jgi:uncharacterized membrane protein YeaQ/YmgE (transglycosylase-associated protein family)
MVGMGFTSFLCLTIIAAIVAFVYHYGLRYRFLEGHDAFVGKLMVGWLGAWLGSPVIGHWLGKVEGVYIVPAILGAIVAIHLNVLGWKAAIKIAGEYRSKALAEIKPMRAAA